MERIGGISEWNSREAVPKQDSSPQLLSHLGRQQGQVKMRNTAGGGELSSDILTSHWLLCALDYRFIRPPRSPQLRLLSLSNAHNLATELS